MQLSIAIFVMSTTHKNSKSVEQTIRVCSNQNVIFIEGGTSYQLTINNVFMYISENLGISSFYIICGSKTRYWIIWGFGQCFLEGKIPIGYFVLYVSATEEFEMYRAMWAFNYERKPIIAFKYYFWWQQIQVTSGGVWSLEESGVWRNLEFGGIWSLEESRGIWSNLRGILLAKHAPYSTSLNAQKNNNLLWQYLAISKIHSNR